MISPRALAPFVLLALSAVPALAQSPWPDANGAPPAAAPQQGGPAGEPPCMKQFLELRGVAEKRAMAIRAASERKASPQEACGLFKSMYEAESKFAKFAADQGPWCGIPDQVVKQLGENLKRTGALRTQICNGAAQAGARPAAPNLSDALSAPVTSQGNVRTGRGTFDTLTGTPLGRSQ
jgi:hypothetical protein